MDEEKKEAGYEIVEEDDGAGCESCGEDCESCGGNCEGCSGGCHNPEDLRVPDFLKLFLYCPSDLLQPFQIP